jgi:hypothetical protein
MRDYHLADQEIIRGLWNKFDYSIVKKTHKL